MTDEELRLLLNVARDATLGFSLQERCEAISEPLTHLLPAASLSVVIAEAAAAPRTFIRGADPADVRAYAERYVRHDPCPAAARAHPGRVATLSQYLPAREFGRDPYTGEFLSARGIRFVMGFLASTPAGGELSFALHREGLQGDFTRRERRLLQLAVEDIGRAVFGALLRERWAPEEGSGVRDASSGAVLFDGSGDVEHADSAGASVLGRLAEETPPGLERLLLAVRRLAATGREGDSDSWTEPLESGAVRVRATSLGSQPGSEVLAVLELLAPPETSNPAALPEEWGLTPREREVVTLVIEGWGNQLIATRLGISPATVAAHLSQVYRKARVSGRAELASRVRGAGPEAPR